MADRFSSTRAVASSRNPRPISTYLRRRQGESHVDFLRRLARQQEKEKIQDQLAPAASAPVQPVEVNYAYQSVVSNWVKRPQDLVPQDLWPRSDTKPLPNGQKAVRESDGRKWPKDLLRVMGGVAAEVGPGIEKKRELMYWVLKAIGTRREETGIEKRVDVGITAEDFFQGCGRWKVIQKGKTRAVEEKKAAAKQAAEAKKTAGAKEQSVAKMKAGAKTKNGAKEKGEVKVKSGMKEKAGIEKRVATKNKDAAKKKKKAGEKETNAS